MKEFFSSVWRQVQLEIKGNKARRILRKMLVRRIKQATLFTYSHLEAV